MLSSTEKLIILSGSLFGSVYLFSISLCSLNDIIIKRNSDYNSDKYDMSNLDKLIIINVSTMIFSGTVFFYFTYFGMK
jgi:hypothetical protein